MTYAITTMSERVRTDKSDHCACARMRDMRLDESWTGRIWDHHTAIFKNGRCECLTMSDVTYLKSVAPERYNYYIKLKKTALFEAVPEIRRN